MLNINSNTDNYIRSNSSKIYPSSIKTLVPGDSAKKPVSETTPLQQLTSLQKKSNEDNRSKFVDVPIEQINVKTADDSRIAAEIKRLRMWEEHVKQHEQTHLAVGGKFAGVPSYTYTVGPDGRKYIQSGEVTMSVPSSGNLNDLVSTLERVKNAAMAPSDPSPADLKAAAAASSKQLAVKTAIGLKKAKEAYEKTRSQDMELKEIKGEYFKPTEKMIFKEMSRFEMFI